ncbi:MAG: cupin domain-containing protein [Bacteroidota bacterium]|nr:cupin domain-containing protein [Bacteroidota bacterium]
MCHLKFLLSASSLVLFLNLRAQQNAGPENGSWSKGASDRFKGDVWVEYFVNDTAYDFLSSRVLFEPFSRSNWHYHKGKQIIFAIDGEGYYKEKGKSLKILRKGDVVIILPGTIHTHGSVGKRFMQGVMMNEVKNQQESTKWLNPVEEHELK